MSSDRFGRTNLKSSMHQASMPKPEFALKLSALIEIHHNKSNLSDYLIGKDVKCVDEGVVGHTPLPDEAINFIESIGGPGIGVSFELDGEPRIIIAVQNKDYMRFTHTHAGNVDLNA